MRRFERLAGRKLAWVYFSNNWWDGEIRFPRGDVERVSAMGRVPFVRLMARSVWREGKADPVFSMQSIADGSWDPAIHDWCAGRRGRDRPTSAPPCWPSSAPR